MKYETSRELPRLQDIRKEQDVRKETAVPTNNYLILLADDEMDNLVMLSLELQSAGYRVLTVSNGAEAVTAAGVAHPNLILMDISMPIMDGLEAARKIRADPVMSNIPIVALTAFETEGFRRAAYDAQMEGYLTKPIDFDRLHTLIGRLLSRAFGPEADNSPRAREA